MGKTPRTPNLITFWSIASNLTYFFTRSLQIYRVFTHNGFPQVLENGNIIRYILILSRYLIKNNYLETRNNANTGLLKHCVATAGICEWWRGGVVLASDFDMYGDIDLNAREMNLDRLLFQCLTESNHITYWNKKNKTKLIQMVKK